MKQGLAGVEVQNVSDKPLVPEFEVVVKQPGLIFLHKFCNGNCGIDIHKRIMGAGLVY